MNIKITWSISKAKDTYGYNRLTALDLETKKKYVAIGGGYDMLGTVIGDLVADKLQSHISMLTPYYIITNNYGLEKTNSRNAFYGLTFNQLTGKAIIENGCGMANVTKIIEACGYQLTGFYAKSKKESYLVLTQQQQGDDSHA
jgi:hypothetical protein